MEDWEKRVIPHFDTLVKVLLPSSFFDNLRSKGLVTREEYSKLTIMDSEFDRSRLLLNDILPRKGPESFDKFCRILYNNEDQSLRLIATDILKWRPEGGSSTSTTSVSPNVPRSGSSDRTASSDRQHSDRKRKKSDGETPEFTASRAKTSTNSADLNPECDSKRATFICAKEDKQLISPLIDHLVRTACYDFYGIESTMVKFMFPQRWAIPEILKSAGHPCYLDAAEKLAVLIVHGVEPAKLEENRQHLCDCILTTLRTQLSSNCGWNAGNCNILEILPKCSYVVLRLDVHLFLALLCVLGNREQRKQFRLKLRELLPSSKRVVLKFGGMPQIDLFDDSKDRHGTQADIIAITRVEGTASCFLLSHRTSLTTFSRRIQLTQLVAMCFLNVDDIDDETRRVEYRRQLLRKRLLLQQQVDQTVREELEQLEEYMWSILIPLKVVD